MRQLSLCFHYRDYLVNIGFARRVELSGFGIHF